jgi:hypothetical protein
MNDATRFALMAFATSLLNVLVGIHLITLDGDQLGQINTFLGNAILILALFWKKGQGSAPPPSDLVVGEDPAQKAVRKASE